MTPRERVLKAIAHEETDIVPYMLPIDPEVDKRLVEYYGGPEYRERIVNHYVFAGPGFPMVTGEPLPDGTARDAFGGRWKFGNIFHQVEWPLKEPTMKALDALQWPDVSKDEYYATLHDLAKAHPDHFTIGCITMTMFERGWALRGMNNILTDMASEPEFSEALFDRITEWDLKIVEKMCDTPVDAIGFTDDLGCQKGLIMGPHLWNQYLKEHLRTVFQYVKSRGKFVYLHSCGDNSDIMEDLIEIGVDILNPMQPEPWDIFEMKRLYGDRITMDGGISSQTTVPFGTVEQVRQEVEKCLREMGKGGGFIIGPNKPIMPGTPVENAVAVVEMLVNQSVRGN